MFQKPMTSSQKCTKHPKEQIIHICFEQNCIVDPLLCVKCLMSNHNNHQTMSIDEFREKIDNIRYHRSSVTQIEEYIINMKTTLSNSLKELEQAKSTITKLIEDIGDKESEYMQRVISTLTKQSSANSLIVNQIQQMSSNGTCEVNLLGPVVQLYNQYLYAETKALEQPKQIVNETTQMMKSISKQINDVISSNKQRLNKIMTTLNSPERAPKSISIKKAQFLWSDSLIHNDIKIQNGVKISRMAVSNNGSSVCVLGSKPLSNRISSIWNIFIKKQVGQLHLGICLKSIGTAHDFVFQGFSNGGHGHYGVDNTAWTFSHTDKNMDFKKNGFSFGTEDNLCFIYKPMEKMLSITKNSEKGIDFNVPPPNEGDSYYIVAYLYKIGDSIQLI